MNVLHCILATLFIVGAMLEMGAPVPSVAADYTTTYTYDDLGRPLSVNVDGSTADFAYDAFGNRTVVSFSPGIMAPTVLVVSPPASATGVSPQVTVTATFSQIVNPATVTTGATGTFRLTGPENIEVPGTVSVHGLEAVFVPSSPLQNGAQYTMTVTTGVRDLAGNSLAQLKDWSFTTGLTPDITPPTVLSSSPASNALNVPVTTVITALFSEALDPATINNTSFLMKNGAYTVWATVDYNESTRTATLTPETPLDPDVTYTTVLLASITDPAGNRLAANREWTFTTVSNGTPVTPAADILIPSDGQTNLPLRTSVGAIFNKAMDQSTINTSTFTLKKGTLAIAGAVSYNPIKHQATFIPTVALDLETEYIATLTTGISDAIGTPLPNTISWSFNTAPLPPFGVTCNLAGDGAGTINSTPPDFACSTESCSGKFPQKSTLLLHPVPYDTSLFIGWGVPCSGTGDCSLTLNADMMLTATFGLKPARIVASLLYFTSLQEAYAGTESNDVIQTKAVTFEEDLTVNGSRAVTIRGGYGAAYTTNGGYGTLQGKLTIQGGQIVVDRLVIK